MENCKVSESTNLPLATLILILVATAATSFLSGIFGMAGGMILMGVLIAILPVSQSMIVHGVIQMTANGWRAFLLRSHINWRVMGFYLIGATPVFLVLLFIAKSADKRLVYLFLGLIPFAVWLPKRFIHLNVMKRRDAMLSGAIVSGLNTIAGVSGPILDMFFVESDMTRQEIVANKSASQVIAHIFKVLVWTGPALIAAQDAPLPPVWLFIAAIPVSMTATWMGGLVLHRMTDIDFKRYMKWLITLVGIAFLARAAGLW